MLLFSNFARAMDINRHIEILLLDNDCVIVPGFGAFMAHYVNARKDKADGSFLPPIRSIGFNAKVTVNDSLLAQSYVDAYEISYPEAIQRLERDVKELENHIATYGLYEFNGIGTVCLNNEGNYEFTPCQAGILTPSLYGLNSFQMKTLSDLNGNASKPWTVASSNSPVGEDGISQNPSHDIQHSLRVIAFWRNVAVACIAAILFLVIPSPLVNNAQMTGNKIDFRLLNRIMPKDIVAGQQSVENAIKVNRQTTYLSESQANKSRNLSETLSQDCNSNSKFSIVLASRVTNANAMAYAAKLTRRGFKDVHVSTEPHTKVLMGHYKNNEEAMNALKQLRKKEEFSGAWVIKTK